MSDKPRANVSLRAPKLRGEAISHPPRGVKTQIVTQAIVRQVGDFAISEIERECPGVSRPMIRVVLEDLRVKGKIKVLGTGRSARWRKRDNKA
jgi:hypothetical protein